MTFFQASRSVMIVSMVLGLGNVAAGAEKENKPLEKEKAQLTPHTVQASVGYPTNAGVGIQAEKQPGSFTIPKGSKGAKLKYSFSDPKSDYTSTKLRGSNIYSVTEKRYMHELDHNPDFELPPGDYKFVVGGLPGASGTLNFRTFASSAVAPPPPGGKPPRDNPTTHDNSKTSNGVKPPGGGQPSGGGTGGTAGLPRDFDIVCNEGPFKEHPLVFRFRGDTFTAQSRFEQSYPIKEGGKSVYTYQTEISGTFRQGKAEGDYVYYGTGGHFGTGPTYSVGLYYKAWIWGPVTGHANGAQLALSINMNRHKHIDRAVPRRDSGWGPWKDNTAMMQDASRVGSVAPRHAANQPEAADRGWGGGCRPGLLAAQAKL